MKLYDTQRLQDHYNMIFHKNQEKLLAGGVGDAYLQSPKSDTRMSLALLIRISSDVSASVKAFLNEIQAEEPELYYYPESDFHITVMDILGGKPHRQVPEELPQYIRCIRECAAQISPFQIHFQGITASDNALMITGYYEEPLEQFRQLLRKSFRKHELVLEERYETFSAHMTVIRTPRQLNDPESFLKFVGVDRNFGTVRVDAVELVFHNWYDSRKTVLETFHFKKKEDET